MRGFICALLATIALPAGGCGEASQRAIPREAGGPGTLEILRDSGRSAGGPGAVVGRSARGAPIRAFAVGGPGGEREDRILVFGCIHGDERAGTAVTAAARARLGRPPESDLVLVPNLNPDGRRLGTRLNSRGVDLNRNFDADWREDGAPGDPEYTGPRPFSEPETRVARGLIERLRPDSTVWYHQQAEPLVRAWGPSVPVAREYASMVGIPFHRLPWIPGTAPNWQNRVFPGTSAFVVELPQGRLARAVARSHALALAGLGRR